MSYDEHYQSENLFGEPYPELIDFFEGGPKEGKVLDLGCGQGRDSIAISRLGYSVFGLDASKVGIEQMNQVAAKEGLDLRGEVGDMYAFDKYEAFDFVLLNSMFHFTKNDREKESAFVQRLISKVTPECIVVVCNLDTGNKVAILNESIDSGGKVVRLLDQSFTYTFEHEGGGESKSDYRMLVVEKQ